VVALTGLVLNTAAVAIVTEWLALSYWYAIMLMVCVVAVALIILNRQWVFRSGTINHLLSVGCSIIHSFSRFVLLRIITPPVG
jgi:hypothetical protein